MKKQQLPSWRTLKNDTVRSQATPRQLGYWLRLLRFFGLALIIAILCPPALLGVFLTWGLLHTGCAASNQTPTDYGYTWEVVTLTAQAGGTFQGYFIPGENGAVIIIPPTGSAGSGNHLREADLLRRHGYAVFAFESRQCAGIEPSSLGYLEVDEVADALDYVLSREDIEPDRIGIHGFSSAGATSIMAAARLPKIQAVVAIGGYGDFDKNAIGANPNRGILAYFMPLYRWGTKLTYRLVTGVDMKVLSPVRVIGEIAPRPILLIYGGNEVSLAGGRQQALAAGDNAELWIVPGAGHGTYLDVAPQEYEQQVVSFFDQALLKN